MLLRFVLSFVSSALVSGVAVRRQMLAPSGAVAAIMVGTLLVTCAGWWSGVVLVTFFALSSSLGRVLRQDDTIQARGNRRDAAQVLANGGIALVCGLILPLSGSHLWLIGLAGAVAAANADTFSTEIGRTSRAEPRMITTGRRVPRGTSGAVSVRGLAGSLVGGFLISMIAGLGQLIGWWHPGSTTPRLVLAIGIAGFLGGLADSVVGATLQCHRHCPHCGVYTEQPVHACGTPTIVTRGSEWVTNDVVNVTCCIVGALLAMVLS